MIKMMRAIIADGEKGDDADDDDDGDYCYQHRHL